MAPADDPYFLQARGFIEACQGKTPAPVSALDGVMAVSIARAAIESAKTLKPVAVAREF
jgi:predicted dehydrogenase